MTPGSQTLGGANNASVAARKYLEMFLVSLQNTLAYSRNLASSFIWSFVLIFVFVQLWRATFSATGADRIDGYSLQEMIWYLVVTESIVLARPRVRARIDQEVKGGDLAYSLGRPYSYLAYHYASSLGEAGFRLVLNLLTMGAVAWLTVGMPPSLRPALLVALVPALLLAYSLDFLSAAAIGLLAFWTEDTSSFALIWDRIAWILGGLLLPLEIFPPLIRHVAEVLPFRYVLYEPARLAVHPTWAGLLAVMGRQAIWLAVFAASVTLLFRAGVKRVHANGG